MDWLILLLIFVVLMLSTISKSCAIQNKDYVITGHIENEILLSNVEKFTKNVEHFFFQEDTTQAATSALQNALGIKDAATKADEAEAEAEIEAAKHDYKKAKLAMMTQKMNAEAEQAKLEAAQAGAEQSEVIENYLNYY